MRLAPEQQGQLTLRCSRESGHANTQGSGCRPILGVSCLGATLPSVAQTPACAEPDKVTGQISEPCRKDDQDWRRSDLPPYVTRDPRDFNQLIGFDADLAQAVFDCAGVKCKEFFLGDESGLLPAVISGQIEVM